MVDGSSQLCREPKGTETLLLGLRNISDNRFHVVMANV